MSHEVTSAAPASAPDQYCITVLEERRNLLGKVFAADGSKKANAIVSRASARTVRCRTHQELAKVIDDVGNNPRGAVILDYFKGMAVGEEFLVLSEGLLRQLLDKKVHDSARIVGTHEVMLDGQVKKVVARLADNFEPSAWIAIDRDVDAFTPEAFATLSYQQYVEALDAAMPGLSKATRVVTLSSSARAARDGKALSSRSGHTLILLRDAADKQRLRVAYRANAIVTGTAWAVPKFSSSSKLAGHAWKCLADESVLSVGRILFCGKPTSTSSAIKILPQKCTIEAGVVDVFDSAAVPDADPERVKAATAGAGSSTSVHTDASGRTSFREASLTLRPNSTSTGSERCG